MTSVILIGTVAIVVAIVGSFVIWRLDASRAEEIDHTPPPPVAGPDRELDAGERPPPRAIDT